MTWDNLNIMDKIDIMGRGKVLVVDLQKSGIVKNKLMHKCPIEKDDIINDGNNQYLVRGIEQSKVLMDFYENIKSVVGLQVVKTNPD